MAKETGGANKITKGVHVDHEFNTFKNETTSETNWASDFEENDNKYKTKILRRQSAGDQVYDTNHVTMDVDCWNQDSSRLTGLAFNADQENVTLDETYKKKFSGYYPNGDVENSRRYTRSCGFPIKTEEIKKICDAETVYMRIQSNGGYIDVDDNTTKKVLSLFKCFYREVYDSEAYDEVADMKPKTELTTSEMAWGCGIIIAIFYVIGLFF